MIQFHLWMTNYVFFMYIIEALNISAYIVEALNIFGIYVANVCTVIQFNMSHMHKYRSTL